METKKYYRLFGFLLPVLWIAVISQTIYIIRSFDCSVHLDNFKSVFDKIFYFVVYYSYLLIVLTFAVLVLAATYTYLTSVLADCKKIKEENKYGKLV